MNNPTKRMPMNWNLSTSDTPGHVMKATDHAKAQGTILGKAMSALKEGKGMVLVLVTLQ